MLVDRIIYENKYTLSVTHRVICIRDLLHHCVRTISFRIAVSRASGCSTINRTIRVLNDMLKCRSQLVKKYDV